MSQNASQILLEKEILLESGTNELEVLVFQVEDYIFGINVAKVREVLPAPEITFLPNAHSSIVGVFRLRETVIPVVSLESHLAGGEATAEGKKLILTDFNNHQTAFVVDNIERIHRLSWGNILGTPSLMALKNTPITAVARVEDRLVIMLDFEMISDQVTAHFHKVQATPNPHNVPRQEFRILVADDSPTVRKAMQTTLEESGYTNLKIFDDGAKLWNHLEAASQGQDKPPADLIITDVEMPQIDGFHLTRRIREHQLLQDLPVILCSSIVSPDNFKKGESVGADLQVTKPELSQVVGLADGLMMGTSLKDSLKARELAAEMAGKEATAVPADTAAATKPAEAATAVQAPPQPKATSKIIEDAAKLPNISSADVSKVSPALWSTFREELTTHCQQLNTVCSAADTQPVAEAVKEFLRVAHTVKSASMVVPVPEISRVTHRIEEMMNEAEGIGQWPKTAAQAFVDWLEELSETAEPTALLANANELLDGPLGKNTAAPAN